MEDNSAGLLEGKPLFFKLLVLLVLVLLGGLLFSGLGMITIVNLTGQDLSEISNNLSTQNAEVIKLLQSFYTLGAFLVPALIFIQLNGKSVKSFLPHQPIDLPIVLMSLVILVCGALAMSGLVYVMYNFPSPSFFQDTFDQLLAQQDKIAKQTQRLLQMDSSSQLWVNVLVMAAFPAIAEEILFRGALQTTLLKHFKNEHKAVLITAFAFAILHQSFFYFLGLFALGSVFGYIKVWTKNIWVCVALHFINNGALVFITFYYPTLLNRNEYHSQLNWEVFLISAVFLVLLLLGLRKYTLKRQ